MRSATGRVSWLMYSQVLPSSADRGRRAQELSDGGLVGRSRLDLRQLVGVGQIAVLIDRVGVARKRGQRHAHRRRRTAREEKAGRVSIMSVQTLHLGERACRPLPTCR